MPIQLRTFYYHRLVELNEKEKSHYDSSGEKNESTSKKISRGPDIQRH